MNMHHYVFGFFLLVTFPAAGFAAQDADPPGNSEQRAACDAHCREDYQNNASALQACLRDCGAVEPAAPSAAPAEASNLNSSRSNVNRVADPATPLPAPAEGTINTSKSNTFRNQATPGTGDVTAAEATTVKSSKSNSSERQAKSVTPPPVPAESANLNMSKSNINREAEDGSSGAAEDTDGDR